MEINIYSNYRVKYIGVGSYISQEDSLPDDVAFNTYGPDTKEYNLTGDLLLKDIQRLFNDEDLDQIDFEGNSLHFGFFKPTTGESSELKMEIEENIDE